MAVHGGHDIDEEGDELQVLGRRLARAEEVHAGIRPERPVVVLARAVDALERLLVQQHAEVVAARYLVHDGHQQLVVVVGEVRLLIYGRHLELVRRHLVVAGLEGYSELEALVFEILHERYHTRWYGAEVVVLELLVLCRLVSHEGASRKHEVGACRPEALVDEEELLLPAQVGVYMLDILVEIAADLRGGLVDGGDGTQQGHLVVERLASVCDEYGGYAECRVDDEGGRRGVPGRVSSGLEGVAYAAVGERRGIGFLLCQHLARECLEDGTLAVGIREGVVLLGRAARQRLEPVGIVVGAVVEGPLAHAGGDAVGQLELEWGAFLHGVEQRHVGMIFDISAHGGAAEDHFAEVFRRARCRCLNLYGPVIQRRFDHLKS